MAIFGCLAAFLLVIVLVYKNWAVAVAALIGAIVCIVTNGLPLWDTMQTVYLTRLTSFVGGYFFIYLFGCIQAQIYVKSGAAISIADKIAGWFNLDAMSQQMKQVTAMIIITLIGTVLAYGGIIVTIVIILLYPIALSILERADIPKKFVLGMLASGTFTFALTGPGTPQTTNIAAMNYMGTTSTAGLVAGIAGMVVEVAVMIIVMNLMINKARAKGEHFAYHELDERYDRSKKAPNFFVSIVPLITVLILFAVAKLRIEYSLALSCIVSLILFYPFLKEDGLLTIVNSGAANSISPVFTVGVIIGLAGVVSSTDAFLGIVDAITKLPLPPIVLLIVCVSITCALTGGSTTGLLVCLPILAPLFLNQFHIPAATIHRVGAFAGSILDTLPYSGSILMLLPMSHMKLKEIYPAMFVTTVLSTFCGTVAVALVMTLLPMLP